MAEQKDAGNQAEAPKDGQEGAAKTGGLLKGRGMLGSRQPATQITLKNDPLFTKLWELRKAYDPKSSAYRFCWIFYNKRAKGPWPAKPENITPEDWEAISKGTPNPEGLVPCPVYGFKALEERKEKQKEFKKKLDERMRDVQKKIKQMSESASKEFKSNFERIQRNKMEIDRLMLDTIGNKEVRERQSIRDLDAEEEKVNKRLEDLNTKINKTGEFKHAIENLRLRVNSEMQMKSSAMSIENESLSKFIDSLTMHQNSIQALETMAKELKRLMDKLEDSQRDFARRGRN